MAATWSNGTLTDLPTLPGYPLSGANAVNDNGEIVGWLENSSNSEQIAVAWVTPTANDPTGIIDIGGPSGMPYSEATGVNNDGVVVGYGGGTGPEEAFSFTQTSGLTALGPAGVESVSQAINSSGEIVGYAGTASNPNGSNAVAWTGGSTPLYVPLIAGSNGPSFATSVNSHGVIVGYAGTSVDDDAFVWDG